MSGVTFHCYKSKYICDVMFGSDIFSPALFHINHHFTHLVYQQILHSTKILKYKNFDIWIMTFEK